MVLFLPKIMINAMILIVYFPSLDGCIPRATSYMILYLSLFGLLECLILSSNHVADLNTRNKNLIAKFLKQGPRYHNRRKTFSKFYRRHYDHISNFNVGLNSS